MRRHMIPSILDIYALYCDKGMAFDRADDILDIKTSGENGNGEGIFTWETQKMTIQHSVRLLNPLG